MSRRDSSAESTPRPSVESEPSTITAKISVDKLYLEINEVDKTNARIKKQILRFGQLESSERQQARDLLNSNLKVCQGL
jgi:hypothetical protein